MLRAELPPHDRLREFITDARSRADNPDYAPSIADVVLKKMWRKLKADNEVLKIVANAGLNSNIRAYLTRFKTDDGGDARQRQLELWDTPAARIVVKKIN